MIKEADRKKVEEIRNNKEIKKEYNSKKEMTYMKWYCIMIEIKFRKREKNEINVCI